MWLMLASPGLQWPTAQCGHPNRSQLEKKVTTLIHLRRLRQHTRDQNERTLYSFLNVKVTTQSYLEIIQTGKKEHCFNHMS